MIRKGRSNLLEEMNTKQKKFSIKRGFIFFVKCQIAVLIMTLIIVSNRNSWGYDGLYDLIIFILFSEIVIFYSTIAACLKPRDYGPVE